MANITVLGAGHAGLATAVSFAELGHRVTVLEINRQKVQQLNRGSLPYYEPGLDDLLRRNLEGGHLFITTSCPSALRKSEFVFICVGTPGCAGGAADLSALWKAAQSICQYVGRNTVVVNKSTVPVGTADRMDEFIRHNRPQGDSLLVVANPEFFAEGSAAKDLLHPEMQVIGSSQAQASEAVAELYRPYGCRIIITDTRTAEMSKYAINTFIAVKISFVNELAALCERLGADIKVVSQTLRSHSRVRAGYLEAGLGWGGSCLPKDVRALEHMARTHGYHPRILRAAHQVNRSQRQLITQKLLRMLGTLKHKTVGILGLSFKPGTDDMREAPSLDIIRYLLKEGCHVQAYDPIATERASQLVRQVTFCTDPYQLATGCDALLLVTEWPQFAELDLRRLRSGMKTPYFIDGRNLFNPREMERAGFIYEGIGLGAVNAQDSPYKPRGEMPAADLSGGAAQFVNLLQREMSGEIHPVDRQPLVPAAANTRRINKGRALKGEQKW